MRAVSAAWLRTITGSHTPQYRATLCTSYQTTNQPTGVRLPIMDGVVTLDGSADIRGSLDEFTVPGSYWPVQGRNVDLAPQGNEVYVQVGLRYSDALIEWCGLGYFRMKTVGQDDATSGGPIRIAGKDRMQGIVRAKLLAPRIFPASTLVGDFVFALASEVYPAVVVSWDDATNTKTLGRDIVVDSDRYGPLLSVAESFGKLMYFDAIGRLAFVSVPNPTVAVAQLRHGTGGTLVAAPRELTDDGVVNAVVARGDGADDTSSAYGVSIDSDPSSPTGYFSRFGPSPKFITNSLITSNIQARAASDAELVKRAGLPYTVGITISPRPELEPYDVVDVDHSGLAGPERHVLSSCKIPLVAGRTMSLVTRQQTRVLIGG